LAVRELRKGGGFENLHLKRLADAMTIGLALLELPVSITEGVEPRTQARKLRQLLRSCCGQYGVEVFTFSTRPCAASGGGGVTSSRSPASRMGGGTTIGACLRDFLRRFGKHMVGRDTVVMIASDGLDIGVPDMLRDAMRELHRRSAA
jgi:VWA domain-containing protein